MENDSFDEAELFEEIDRAIAEQREGRVHHLAFTPCPQQQYYLIQARKAEIHWKDIVTYCKARGWPGSQGTMLKWLREQGEE